MGHALDAPPPIASGAVIETSSTFEELMLADCMPRVSSGPAAPGLGAEAGVLGGEAGSGSLASPTMPSRTRLVSGTSAVGMSQNGLGDKVPRL